MILILAHSFIHSSIHYSYCLSGRIAGKLKPITAAFGQEIHPLHPRQVSNLSQD